MEKVKKQIEFIRGLLDDFEDTLYDRSYWRSGTVNSHKNRIQDAKTILKACELLVELTKSAKMETLKRGDENGKKENL